MVKAVESESSSNSNSADVAKNEMADAVKQMKAAAATVYDAVGTLGNATASSARTKMGEGQRKAQDLEGQAEQYLRERPLVAVGVAFAAGWVVSRLMSGSRK